MAAKRNEEVFLTIPEIAQRYRTNEQTVRYWRHTGYGPKGIKVGVRVLYRLTECERWEREQEAAQAAG